MPSPFDCYLVLRGIKTLPLRMQRHAETAARACAGVSSGTRASRACTTPACPATRSTRSRRRQMSRGGGMICVELEGGLDARAALPRARCASSRCAESLGGVESLAEHPAIMTHASIPPEPCASRSASRDALVRLSVGLEHVEDLWADLERGLRAARAMTAPTHPSAARTASWR